MLQGGVLETLVQCYGTSGDCNTHIQTHTHKIIQACDFDLQIFFLLWQDSETTSSFWKGIIMHCMSVLVICNKGISCRQQTQLYPLCIC